MKRVRESEGEILNLNTYAKSLEKTNYSTSYVSFPQNVIYSFGKTLKLRM